MVIPVAADPVTFIVRGFEKSLSKLPWKAAETLIVTGPGTVSNSVKRNVKVLSPAAASPLRPSSWRFPKIPLTGLLESRGWRFTLSAITVGSVITAVTVIIVATPTGAVDGYTAAESIFTASLVAFTTAI